MQPQPPNGPSPSPDHDHHSNHKSVTTTMASSSSASPLMKFPSLHELQGGFHQMHQQGYDHHAPPPHDDFLEQMLSSLNSASAWDSKAGGDNDSASPEEESETGVSAGGFQFDESSSKLLKAAQQQQQMLPMPFGGMDDVVHHRGSLLEGSSFDSFHPGVENQMAGLFNGSFVGSLLGSGQQMDLPEHFRTSQGGPGYEVPAAMNNSVEMMSAGAAAAQPKQRVRARRGQATDPHSIAERLRRERIAERMKGLQELVPNANKTDKASMLDEIIEYVKFLQLQVKVLSMSRLGGAGGVAPLAGDNMSSEGAGDSLRARARAMMIRGGSNGELTATSTEELATANNSNNTAAATATATAVNENQVAKLMEEDMGSAMQYLQSKGLCLMPISLAAAISTAKNPLSSSSSAKRAGTNSSPRTSNGNGPVSPRC